MKEMLEPYVKSALDSGAKGAEKILDFIQTQTPELVGEVIRWGIVSELMAPIVGILILIGAFIAHMRYRKNEHFWIYSWNTYSGSHDAAPGFGWIIMVTYAVGTIVFLTNIMDVVYPLVAPRLYLLEKIADLVK